MPWQLVRTRSDDEDAKIHRVVVVGDDCAVSGDLEGELVLWDLTLNSSPPRTLGHHAGQVTCLAALPALPDGAGRAVSGCGFCPAAGLVLKIWHLRTLQCLQELTGHTEQVLCVASVSDERVVSGSGCRANEIKVWSVSDGRCLHTLTQSAEHTRAVSGLAEVKDGRVIAATSYGMISIWDVDAGRCLQTFAAFEQPVDHDVNQFVSQLATLPKGRVVIASYEEATSPENSKLQIFDPDEGLFLPTISTNSAFPQEPDLAVLPGGQIALASDKLEVWDLSSGTCLQTLEEDGDITCLDVLSDGRILSAYYQGKLKLWIDTRRVVEKLAANSVARQRACRDVAAIIEKFL